MHYAIGLTVEAKDEEEARKFAETVGAGPGQQWDKPLIVCGPVEVRETTDPAARLAGIDKESLKGFEIMQEVLTIVLNREETPAEQINAYLQGDDGASGLYEAHIAPAITAVEETIRRRGDGK